MGSEERVDDARSGEDGAGATADDGATGAGPASRKRRRGLPGWLETIVLVVVAVVQALVVKTFLAQAFYIPSSSMEPGLEIDDRIVVQKVSYWFGGTPERGDVIVFEDPAKWLGGETAGPTNVVTRGLEKIGLYPSGGHLVKRVIGVAGDTIECCDDEGRLMVNGEPLDEDSFIDPQQKCDGPMPTGCGRDWSAGPVPEGTVFVMGDNRDDSADSSVRLCIGAGPRCDASKAYVPVDLVVGKVLAVVWPFSHFSTEERPAVFDTIPDP